MVKPYSALMASGLQQQYGIIFWGNQPCIGLDPKVVGLYWKRRLRELVDPSIHGERLRRTANRDVTQSAPRKESWVALLSEPFSG